MAQQVISEKCYAYISGAWVQLLDVAPISVSRGLSDNNPETRLADIGEVSLSLNNNSGVYTPGTTAGWKKGIPFKLVITYDGLDYVIFRGAISDIELEKEPGDKIVKITALDWMDYASKYPIVNPDLLEDITASFAIDDIVNDMPIQPQVQTLDAGSIIYPTVFDTVRENTKAYSEFAKLANSETGYVYLKADRGTGENLVYESLDFRNGTRKQKTVPASTSDSRTTTTADVRLTTTGDIRITSTSELATFDDVHTNADVEYGKRIINRFKANAYPKRTDSNPVLIYESEKDIYLASGKTKTFRIFWKDPIGKRSINAIPPSATAYTKCLLHFDEQQGNTFVDEFGHVFTQFDAPLVTNVVKFGTGSTYMDGSASYLTSPNSEDWEFGSGDFCVEWWEYRFRADVGESSISRDGTAGYPAFKLGRSDATNLGVYISSNGISADIANNKSLGVISLNTWNHFAVSRSGSNFYAFKNGAITSTWTSAAALFASTGSLAIGLNVAFILNACIDEVRITKGIPVYTAAFTAPTTAFPMGLGTFFHVWTGRNRTGTDISSSLITSTDYGTEGATFTVTNGSASAGYLIIKTYGYGIYSDSALEDTQEDSDSINTYGHQNETLQQAYQQDTYLGILEGKRVVEFYNQPRTILNSISMYANASSLNMMSFLYLDIGDIVRIKIGKHGIDSMFFIQGIIATIAGGLILYTWIVKEVDTLELGYSQMAVEFAGGASGDAVNFGYLPTTSQDYISHRAFSAWIYSDGLSTDDRVIIMGQHEDNGGVRVELFKSAGAMYLQYYNSLYAGNALGIWLADTALSASSWHHIFISQDTSITATTDPLFFIDGAAVAITETYTPVGALDSDEGNPVIIGNMKTVTRDYDRAFDGKIKDARIYDMSKAGTSPSDLAAGIYAEGAGEAGFYNGLVFQAFVVRTEDVTAYTDLTMTDEKILESFNGYVGTPNGSPIVRTP